MTRASKKRDYNMPLVHNPRTKTRKLTSHRSEVEIEITACPDQWIEYKTKWLRQPPAGITAVLHGQVTLVKNGAKSGIGSPAASKISVRSDQSHPIPGWRGHPWQLEEIVDFEFWGELLETSN
jgi:hypothetical protein